MIRINCTECKTSLEIDDAFAGGVCRCQHCGTIQTVPSRSKGVRPAAPVSGPTPKPAYQAAPRSDGRSGSGLRGFADTIPSSGTLSGDGKPRNRVRERNLSPGGPATSPGHAHSKNLMPLLIGAGVLIVILGGAVTWLAVRSPAGSPAPEADRTPEGAAPVVAPSPQTVAKAAAAGSNEIKFPTFGTAPKPADPTKLVIPPANQLAKLSEPQFYGVRIDSPTIVYILDRSTSMTDPTFKDLRSTFYRSLDSLKPTQQIRAVFVGKKGQPVVWPETGFAAATKENIAACKKTADGIKLITDKDLQPQEAFAKAFADSPERVIFATARDGYDDRAASGWLGNPVISPSTKIYGFNLGGANGTSRALKKLADSSHGLYRELSPEDVRAFAQGRK